MIYRFTLFDTTTGAETAQGFVRAEGEAAARAMLGGVQGAELAPQPGRLWPGAIGASLHLGAGDLAQARQGRDAGWRL